MKLIQDIDQAYSEHTTTWYHTVLNKIGVDQYSSVAGKVVLFHKNQDLHQIKNILKNKLK